MKFQVVRHLKKKLTSLFYSSLDRIRLKQCRKMMIKISRRGLNEPSGWMNGRPLTISLAHIF